MEPIAIYMTAELLGLLELLHSLQIVHADIKPDNFHGGHGVVHDCDVVGDYNAMVMDLGLFCS